MYYYMITLGSRVHIDNSPSLYVFCWTLAPRWPRLRFDCCVRLTRSQPALETTLSAAIILPAHVPLLGWPK